MPAGSRWWAGGNNEPYLRGSEGSAVAGSGCGSVRQPQGGFGASSGDLRFLRLRCVAGGCDGFFPARVVVGTQLRFSGGGVGGPGPGGEPGAQHGDVVSGGPGESQCCLG